MARRRRDGTIAPPNPGGWDPSRMTAEGQKTKRITGGNCRADQEWLAAEAGNLNEVDPKTLDDCPWDVKLRWDGYVDEVNEEFFEPYYRSSIRRCTGIAYIRDERGGYIIDLDGVRLFRPCLRIPLLGAHVCPKHGGQVAHVREAAQRRLSHAAEKAANTLITLTDPRDEIGEIVDQNVRVKAANSVLDRAGIKAGVEVEVKVPGYKDVLQAMFGEEEEKPNGDPTHGNGDGDDL